MRTQDSRVIHPYRQYEGRLLKTGQTTDYTPAGRTSKDDGGEEQGIAKKYNILTTGQYSGTTDITVNAKTDTHSNEAVLDLITGLMWSRNASASVGPSSTGTLLWEDAVNSEDIFEYCDQANIAGLSGHGDWRVPNSFEIYSLSEIEAPDSAPDSTAFPVIPSSAWASTSNPSLTTRALLIGFSFGTIGHVTKTSAAAVFLVRN